MTARTNNQINNKINNNNINKKLKPMTIIMTQMKKKILIIIKNKIQNIKKKINIERIYPINDFIIL